MTDKPDWLNLSREERFSRVAEMCVEGLSSSKIAARFANVSRNGVLGFRHRHKIPTNYRSVNEVKPVMSAPAPKPPVQKPETVVVAKPPAVRKPSALVTSIGLGAPVGDRVPRLTAKTGAFDPLSDRTPIEIWQLPLIGRCRWPVDGAEGVGLLACGAHAPDTESYCTTHHRMSVNPRAAKGTR